MLWGWGLKGLGGTIRAEAHPGRRVGRDGERGGLCFWWAIFNDLPSNEVGLESLVAGLGLFG